MFNDDAIEQMVMDAFDELCDDQGIDGPWREEGPMALALVPDPTRLGAAVDLWMRIENREETARQQIVERTTIFGSSQLAAPGAQESDIAEGDEEDVEYAPEPILDEIELRGRLLVDVLNVVSQQLSDRRGALELGEDLLDLDGVRTAMIEALDLQFRRPPPGENLDRRQLRGGRGRVAFEVRRQPHGGALWDALSW